MSLLLSVALMMSSAASTTVVLPGGEDGNDVELNCGTGPVDREFGGSAFALYSCDDGKSLVAVAKPGSRAFPFYFIVSPDADQVRLYGEGDGDEDATGAAFSDLNEVTPEEIAAIVAETRSRG